MLLPPDCVHWNLAKREAVLSHERSHVVRGDCYLLLLAALNRALFWFSPFAWLLRMHLRRQRKNNNPLANAMVWLGEGFDAGDGRLSLRRGLLPPFEPKLDLRWDSRRSRPVIEAILDLHRRLSAAGGGSLQVPLYWSLLGALVTVHPLGGCRIGSTPADGVVDHRGEVFGYPGLYVVDGATLPAPVGRNPSLTIAALAERAARLMLSEEGNRG